MNEEVRTLKVYDKVSYQCYRAEVRDKNLEDIRPSATHEWEEEVPEEDPKEDPEEESSESRDTSAVELDDETDIDDGEDHIEDEYLEREAEELTRLLYRIHERDTTTLKIVRSTMKEGIHLLNREIDSRGPDETERRWHTNLHMLGSTVNRFNNAEELIRKKEAADWLMEHIDEAMDAQRRAPKSRKHKQWIKRWKRHQEMTKSKCGVKKPTTMKVKRKKKLQREAVLKWMHTRHEQTVPAEGAKLWCDHPDCQRRYRAITEDEPERTYPL
ncbi:hypothetical protein A2U01_0023586 [Trifolium medium]|uniref:Uncharacterized protein n=1 Tax=Trifolium medium TaxID=97028 RepID=A0A392NRW2_9FABA|nr:hypothetical protein [Trifolium medium]